MCAVDVVNKLVEEFEKRNMFSVVVYGEDSSPVIEFEGANESDCSVSVILSVEGVILQRVVGANTIEQSFRFEDINEAFFDLVRDHYGTIRSLIRFRDNWLGKT